MLKKLKLKNSTILLIGVIIIIIGVGFALFEYFGEKKNKVFSEMNIMLYESELPENIESEEELNIKKDENPVEEEPNETDQPEAPAFNYSGILEIPNINLKRGFLDLNSRYNNVDYNITVIKGSTFPNEANNNLILAAHSGICPVCYFDDLYKLSIGDTAYIYYSNVKYSYHITNIYEVEKNGTVAIYRDYSKKTLTLITCTRNSNTKQTIYILELIGEENY